MLQPNTMCMAFPWQKANPCTIPIVSDEMRRAAKFPGMNIAPFIARHPVAFSFGAIGSIAVLVNFAPIFNQTRHGFTQSFDKRMKTQVPQPFAILFKTLGATCAFIKCSDYAVAHEIDAPFFLKDKAIWLILIVEGLLMGWHIGTAIAPVMYDPLMTMFQLIWSTFAGLVADVRSLINQIRKTKSQIEP